MYRIGRKEKPQSAGLSDLRNRQEMEGWGKLPTISLAITMETELFPERRDGEVTPLYFYSRGSRRRIEEFLNQSVT